jgi:endogenous inhibitor of DNA gyrase (YacG/DUF329 family)
MFTVSCPICQKRMEVRDLSEWPNFPFCGQRCRTIDLGRWLGGAYRVPDDTAPAPADPADSDPVP